MAVSKESADAIQEGIKTLNNQKNEILEKVNQTQEEIDNLIKRRDQIQAQADEIDLSIAAMTADLNGRGVKI